MGGAASTIAPLHGRRTPPAPHPIIVASFESGARLQVASVSHTGLVRDNNEDAILTRFPEPVLTEARRGALVAVADGVGGAAAGEVASRTAVDFLAQEYYSPRAPHQIEAALRQAMQAANLAVYTMAHGPDPALQTMQTTLAALVLAGPQAYVAHAGDTRVYLLRGGTATQLTGDHSEAAELLRLRLITPEQAQSHPRRSVLTRALGATPLMRPDFQRAPVQAGDRFLLCTDGLWSEVAPDALRAALARHPVGEAELVAERLLALALGAGDVGKPHGGEEPDGGMRRTHGTGSDNVSFVVVDVLDPGPAVAAAPAGRIGRLLAGLRGGG